MFFVTLECFNGVNWCVPGPRRKKKTCKNFIFLECILARSFKLSSFGEWLNFKATAVLERWNWMSHCLTQVIHPVQMLWFFLYMDVVVHIRYISIPSVFDIPGGTAYVFCFDSEIHNVGFFLASACASSLTFVTCIKIIYSYITLVMFSLFFHFFGGVRTFFLFWIHVSAACCSYYSILHQWSGFLSRPDCICSIYP